MSFNALSLSKLGIGFGAMAVASIGLLSPAPVEIPVTPPQTAYQSAVPRVKAAVITIRAAAKTTETERFHVNPVVVISAQGHAEETERTHAGHALIIQAAATTAEEYSRSIATGRARLDWQHIAKLDDEALAAGLL